MEEIFFKWIPQVGFPIVVAAYILIRIEPKLSKLIEAITTLIPIVKEDSGNTKDVKEAISDLRVEISKINGKK
ncbi:MAG: YvrJ family protein [Candidatus Marinimicrobia bacterium]|nr:YvrJ family protein [Candidatus Neomarinimicrobiota bacterium]